MDALRNRQSCSINNVTDEVEIKSEVDETEKEEVEYECDRSENLIREEFEENVVIIHNEEVASQYISYEFSGQNEMVCNNVQDSDLSNDDLLVFNDIETGSIKISDLNEFDDESDNETYSNSSDIVGGGNFSDDEGKDINKAGQSDAAVELSKCNIKMCNICGQLVKDNNQLQRHINMHLDVKPHKCIMCKLSFSSGYDLNIHKMKHAGIKPYMCLDCGKSYARPYSLKIHERTHTDVKPYTCNVCGKTFKISGNLRSHERIHTGVKRYKCSVCEKNFFWKCRLDRHERMHTTTPVKPNAIHTSLKVRERTHTGVRDILEIYSKKRYTCNICEKSFKVSGNLRSHERIHAGIKPYKCSFCEMRFYWKCRLDKHEKTHTAIRTVYVKSNFQIHS